MDRDNKIYLRTRVEEWTEVHRITIRTYAYPIHNYRGLKILANFYEVHPERRPDLLPHQKQMIKNGCSVGLAEDCILDFKDNVFGLARFALGRSIEKRMMNEINNGG